MPENLPTPLSVNQKKYDNFLSKMTEIGENDIIVRNNCKFCKHPARFDAEEVWERSRGSFSTVERFFESYRKDHPDAPHMNTMNIQGHINHHYLQQIKKLRMREYADNLKVVMKERVDQIDMLDSLMTSLSMKYIDVASDSKLDPIKQADSEVKISKVLLDIIKLKLELSGDIKPITVFVEKTMHIFNAALQQETNQVVKEKLFNVITAIEAEAGDIA